MFAEHATQEIYLCHFGAFPLFTQAVHLFQFLLLDAFDGHRLDPFAAVRF